jgi:hypothetical protein
MCAAWAFELAFRLGTLLGVGWGRFGVVRRACATSRVRGARDTKGGVLMGEQSIAVVRHTQQSVIHDYEYAVDEDIDDNDDDDDDDDQHNEILVDLRPRVIVLIAALAACVAQSILEYAEMFGLASWPILKAWLYI